MLAGWSQVPGGDVLLDACHQVAQVISNNQPAAVQGDIDPLLWATAVRSIKTTYGIGALCTYGFGEQAAMLCRSVFEDMAIAQWIRQASPPEVRRLFLEGAERARAERQRDFLKHGQVEQAASLGPLDDRRREEVLKGRRPPLWVGKGVYQMLKEIEPHWPASERTRLWEMHDLTHGLHNWMLHNSPVAMELTTPAGMLSSARSDQYVAETLRATLYSISHLGRAVVQGEGRAALDALLSDLRPLLVPLRNEQLTGVGRNDPCPCGSGKKFKACHGR